MRNIIRNKRGDMVLRDIVFIIIIFTGIVALLSIFVGQMGTTYEDYTNMSIEYNQDDIGDSQLNETGDRWQEISISLTEGNIIERLWGTAEAAGEIILEIVKAPATFSDLVSTILDDLGVQKELTNSLSFILTATLYILIAFVIITAFLPGGGKT